MATITSRGPVLIDYLVTLFTNAATLGAAAAPGTVAIYDGPVTTGLDSPLKLYIGWTDPDNTAGVNASGSNQTWAGLGRFARHEHLTLHCCADAWSGPHHVKTCRPSCTSTTSPPTRLIPPATTPSPL